MADDTTREQSTDEPWAPWRSRLSASRRRREDRIASWQQNVASRTGGPLVVGSSSSTGVTRTVTEGVVVNQDWPLTKAKIAQLYSQTPEVRLTPRNEQFAGAASAFGRELNDTISDVSVGSTIEEVLADVVNAAGIGAVIVSCDKRTEERMVPKVDPMIAGMSEQPPEMMPVTAVVDIQYLGTRISPGDLLIPSDFTGSNYDHARWLAHDDRMTAEQATVALHLTDEQIEEALSKDNRANSSRSLNTDSAKFKDTEGVNYTQVFYWRHFYHADETNFHALQRLVFVEGIDEPVINEPYQVQQRVEGRLIGVTKNPIRVLTLTYISDDSLPPSDSTVSRCQVDELEQSRDQMVQQRKHSIPIRWGNTNLISNPTKTKIDEGKTQGWIWINGRGESAIGEVARASFPSENFDFDKIIKSDITEMWQVGSNQAGAFAQGERSAREAGIIEKNFQRRVGQEQDKVQKFFLGIAEVLAGHLAMYGTFDLPDELGSMRQQMANAFTYSVRVDSTVRLDAEQRIEQLTRALNLTAQSGYVNPKPVIAEIWELSGVDPAKVVIDPQPKAPEPVKISVSKAEDLMNPLFLAAIARTDQLPGVDDVSAVAKLLEALGAIPGMASLLAPPAPPQGEGKPPRDAETPSISNAGWETSPRIERRAEDGGA